MVAIPAINLPAESMETQIKNAVLRMLDEAPLRAHPIREVVDEVSHQFACPKAAVKTALWELYSDGALELTPDWSVLGARNHIGAVVA